MCVNLIEIKILCYDFCNKFRHDRLTLKQSDIFAINLNKHLYQDIILREKKDNTFAVLFNLSFLQEHILCLESAKLKERHSKEKN